MSKYTCIIWPTIKLLAVVWITNISWYDICWQPVLLLKWEASSVLMSAWEIETEDIPDLVRFANFASLWLSQNSELLTPMTRSFFKFSYSAKSSELTADRRTGWWHFQGLAHLSRYKTIKICLCWSWYWSFKGTLELLASPVFSL